MIANACAKERLEEKSRDRMKTKSFSCLLMNRNEVKTERRLKSFNKELIIKSYHYICPRLGSGMMTRKEAIS
jgi:hypothetical protein